MIRKINAASIMPNYNYSAKLIKRISNKYNKVIIKVKLYSIAFIPA